jgi:hypothetical protein
MEEDHTVKMKKLVFIFLITLFLGCSKTKKKTTEFTKLKLVNRASHFFNGKPNCYLEDKKEIDYVFNVINSLNEDYSDRILISVNYSYVEVLLVDENSNKEEFFSVVFTQHNGDVIRYGGKHYYYNQELVNFIKDKLNMREEPIIDSIKQ